MVCALAAKLRKRNVMSSSSIVITRKGDLGGIKGISKEPPAGQMRKLWVGGGVIYTRGHYINHTATNLGPA